MGLLRLLQVNEVMMFSSSLQRIPIRWKQTKLVETRGQSYKANFGINYIKNGHNKLNFNLNKINFDVIYAKKIYKIDPSSKTAVSCFSFSLKILTSHLIYNIFRNNKHCYNTHQSPINKFKIKMKDIP